MKITLVRCPCIEPFSPDVGLSYISSFLKERGNNDVFIFDLNIEAFHNSSYENKQRWLTSEIPVLNGLAEDILLQYPQIVNESAKRILETEPGIIGFSVWDSNILYTLKLAEAVRRLDTTVLIIFGGPECYPLWSGDFFIKSNPVDIVIYGEGELALWHIVESIKRTEKVRSIPGCLIKADGKIVNCGLGEVIGDLDTLPFPDYRDFPLDFYPQKNRLFISFSRGCIRKCAYCSVPGTFPSYRFRSADSIFEEIKCQIERHPSVCDFLISSPALNSNLKQLSGLCNLIIANGIKVKWGGNAVIRPDMDIDVLKKMKEAGCSNLVFGIESGSQKILDRMGKSFRIEDAERILYDAHKANIESITANFIIGFPGEEDDDFYQTLEFIKRNKNYIESIGSYTTCWIEPYSPIYYNPEKFGVVLDNSSQGKDMRHFSNWYSEDGKNTPEIRQKRKDIFENFISSLSFRKKSDNYIALDHNG